jgi:O-antigen/teichoic acid export membrane protein
MNQDSSKAEVDKDRTGRDRIIFNIIWGWCGQSIIIFIGFVMPRMIDQHIGQFSLGVWDFCWTLVNYLSLSSFGIGSSVNRYVAKFRSSYDVESLNKTVSSVLCVQSIVATFIVLGTIVLALILPYYFSEKIGNEILNSQYVVITLGISVAVEQYLNPFRGVLTGCHRWDIHNAINVLSRVVGFGGMVGVLFLGFGLRGLGIIYLCTVILTEIIRVFAAIRFCPELKIRTSYVDWGHAKEMILFGAKTVGATLSTAIILQTTNVLIVANLGPNFLAVFSRSNSLIRFVETFINRFSFITTPTVGALQAKSQFVELKHFMLESSRFATAIMIPITLIFVFNGELIITAWMGTNYANNWVMIILALGNFLPISQSPVLRILIGLNLHGRIGIISLVAVIVTFFLGTIILNVIGWNIIRIALIMGISLSIGNGILIPLYACRYFKIPVLEYVRHVFLGPLTCCLLYIVILYGCRVLFSESTLVMFCVGTFGGGLVTVYLYWRFLLTDTSRAKILDFVKRKKAVL